MSVSISQAINGTLTLITVGREIYESVAQFMDAMELEKTKGADKKSWVMAMAKNLILESGKNWNKWEKHISDFIDASKSIYNALKGIF